jgi:hypothetical protein
MRVMRAMRVVRWPPSYTPAERRVAKPCAHAGTTHGETFRSYARWGDTCEAVRLADLPYRQLTQPVRVMELDLERWAAADVTDSCGGDSAPQPAGPHAYPSTARVRAQVTDKGAPTGHDGRRSFFFLSFFRRQGTALRMTPG